MFYQKLFTYGTKALLRDNFICKKRLQLLLKNDRSEKCVVKSFSDRLLYQTILTARQKLKAYELVKKPKSSEGIVSFLKEHFPIIQKQDLLNNRKFFYPNSGYELPWVIKGRTSGTTGTPLEIFRSLGSIVWENAFVHRHWAWSGFFNGMKRATMRGDYIVPIDQSKPPFWHFNKFNNQLFISSRHLKSEYINFIIDSLINFNPFILQAYPSTAFELAKHLDNNRISLSIPYVFTGSEILYTHQRELIESRIGKVMDFYGMAERVCFASECEYGNLHVNTDYSYVEIVDESGNPTDKLGYIVGTTLHNKVMPLIRYKLSDMSKWKKGNCKCKRPYPMIEAIEGKFEDQIFSGMDNPISPSIITFAFKGVQNISKSQVAQVDVNQWEIRIVPMPNYSKEDGNQIINNIHTLVDPGLNLKVVLMNDISPTTAGKYRWVVNETNQHKS